MRIPFGILIVFLVSGLSGLKAQGLHISSSDTIFCQGDSVILEASHGFHNYEWNTGDTGRLLYVKHAGTYIIHAKDSLGNNYSDSITIQTHHQLSLSYSSHPDTNVVCIGDSLHIELNHGFAHYVWNIGGNGRLGHFYIDEDKHIIIEAEDSNGCEYRLEINIESVHCDSSCPELIGYWPDSTACAGDSIILEVPSGYHSYIWSDGTEGRIRSAKESGWYVVTVEVSDGVYCSDSVYLTIFEDHQLHVFSNPSPAKICLGDSIVIEIGGHFAQYWWNTGHSGDRNVLHPTHDFTLVIEATDSNGCDDRIEFEIEVDSCTNGIPSERDLTFVRIFPNPFTERISINIQGAQYFNQSYTISDLRGHIVLEGTLQGRTTELNAYELSPGVYILRLGQLQYKLIKVN